MQTEVVLGIGGNKGDRADFLQKAMEALSQQATLVGYSQIYETEVWGGVATSGNFLNQVVLIHTQMDPLVLLEVIQGIEEQLGRTREQHWGDRTIDIDILYFGSEIWNTPTLSIPHPYLAQRRFVLQPLAEILPKKIHPILKKTTLVLLAECTDLGQVSVWKEAK
jgi:2-amino-4-hydroxy-6-hydroxymethyldihydropteridine diphosphokinase